MLFPSVFFCCEAVLSYTWYTCWVAFHTVFWELWCLIIVRHYRHWPLIQSDLNNAFPVGLLLLWSSIFLTHDTHVGSLFTVHQSTSKVHTSLPASRWYKRPRTQFYFKRRVALQAARLSSCESSKKCLRSSLGTLGLHWCTGRCLLLPGLNLRLELQIGFEIRRRQWLPAI